MNRLKNIYIIDKQSSEVLTVLQEYCLRTAISIAVDCFGKGITIKAGYPGENSHKIY